jgi:circadian clock protein KaiB
MNTGDASGGQSAAPAGPADRVIFDLQLYIAGLGPKSILAIENLRRVCDEYLPGRYRIEVIDLLETPELARGEGIIAVPTLVRRLPLPVRTIIGDLSDTDRVLVGLQLRPDGWGSL